MRCLKKSVLLLAIGLLISGANADALSDCEKRNANYVYSLQSCNQAYNDLDKKYTKCRVERDKKNEYIVRVPFTSIGLETAEARGAIITLAGTYIHPICFVALFF